MPRTNGLLTSEIYVEPVANIPPSARQLTIFPASKAPRVTAVYWMAIPAMEITAEPTAAGFRPYLSYINPIKKLPTAWHKPDIEEKRDVQILGRNSEWV